MPAIEEGGIRYFDQGFTEHAKELGVHMHRVPNPRVVIFGNEVLSPFGDLDQTFAALLRGDSAVRAYPEAQNWRTNIAAPLLNDPKEQFSHMYTTNGIRRLGRATILSDALTRMLAQKSDLLGPDGKLKPGINPTRFGLWIGSGIGPSDELIEVEKTIEAGVDKKTGEKSRVQGSRDIEAEAGIRLFPQSLIGAPSRSIGAQGMSGTVPAACATGGFNIAMLSELIRNGYLDAGIAGGLEYAVNSSPGPSIGVFARNKVTSARNDEPHRASRPFDVDRDGFVPGSGAALTGLASLEFALSHGLPIIGEVFGSVNRMDAFHVTALDKDNVALVQVQALLDEENQAFRIPDVIGAHATSTPSGDLEEGRSIKLAFGEKAGEIAITAIKGGLGHSMGAIGGENFAIGCKIIETGWVPHTINLENVDPEVAELGLDLVRDQPRHQSVTIFLADSFGFDGHANAIAIGKYAA